LKPAINIAVTQTCSNPAQVCKDSPNAAPKNLSNFHENKSCALKEALSWVLYKRVMAAESGHLD
jgi:hypothetical protein